MAGLPKDRMTPDALENLAKMLSSENGIRLVQGKTWFFDQDSNTLVYDRAQLLGMKHTQAAGLLIHNMGHAVYSLTKRPLKREFEEFHKKVRDRIPPAVVPAMYEAMEDERSEYRMSHNLRNMRNQDLPVVYDGYRKEYFEKDLEAMRQVSQPGEVNKDTGVPVYYERAATAMRGLVSRGLERKDLPKDMPWSEELCNEIKSLRDEETPEGALDKFYDILNKIITTRENPPTESETSAKKPGEGEGDEDGEGQGKPGEGGRPDPNAIGKEVKDGTFAQRDMDPSLVGGKMAGMGDGRRDGGSGPSYVAVKGTVNPIINGILKQARRFLKENEIVDIERGHRQGRFNGRQYARRAGTADTSFYTRRSEEGERSYAVGVMIDVSSSMHNTSNTIENYPEVFGDGHQHGGIGSARDAERMAKDAVTNTGVRNMLTGAASFNKDGSRRGGGSTNHLAARMGVAVIESFAQFKEVQTAIGTFQGSFKLYKDFRDKFDNDKKQRLMNEIADSPGGTSLGPSVLQFMGYFKKAKADRKMMIVITDGGISGSDSSQLKKFYAESNIELVVLNLEGNEYTLKTVSQVVGRANTDNVTDRNVVEVLGRHLKRMVAGSSKSQRSVA